MSNALSLEQMKAELETQSRLIGEEIALAAKKQGYKNNAEFLATHQALLNRLIENIAHQIVCQVVENLFNQLGE
tara:strand:+ start:4938 stop:5159 length:222 start_codon:yes stop_codon:yes gene_type:complete